MTRRQKIKNAAPYALIAAGVAFEIYLTRKIKNAQDEK